MVTSISPALLGATNSSAANAVKQPAGMEAIHAKAKELEGVFLNTLLSEMFSGLDARNMFGGGYAEETWRSMQAEQYAEQISQAGGIGLADQIVSNLLAMQESAQKTTQDNPAGASRLAKGAYIQ